MHSSPGGTRQSFEILNDVLSSPSDGNELHIGIQAGQILVRGELAVKDEVGQALGSTSSLTRHPFLPGQ